MFVPQYLGEVFYTIGRRRDIRRTTDKAGNHLAAIVFLGIVDRFGKSNDMRCIQPDQAQPNDSFRRARIP